LRAQGITTHSLSSCKWALHQIVLRLAARLRRGGYDIVHLHLPASTLIGSFLARWLSNAAVLATVYVARHQVRWAVFALFRLTAPLVTRLVTIIPISRTELRSMGVSEDKIRFVPMGLDFGEANPDRHDELRLALSSTYGFDPQRPLLLSVARLARDRHIHVLVEAMVYIAQECPDAVLLMIGDGTERARLEDLVRQHRLQANVIFAEPRMDIWNVLPGCDVYVSAAVGASVGVAALQAMACARPVAAYDITPTPDEQALRTEHVVFISARDARALARVVSELIADKGRATELGHEARRRVTESASLEAMITRYKELYALHIHQARRY
jgi:glycosyltransferase involved in cell wall biosynthesis